jgi:tetratricopeptide (TPR) repeat protein
MTASKDQAIQLALHGEWEKAIELNQQILLDTPDDFETLNRIAFAYTALRRNEEAAKTYKKVLLLDNQNPIALKNLKRLEATQKTDAGKNHIPHFAALADTMFIEENGKTKVVELINVAQLQIIAHLMTGEMIHLRIKRSKVFVLDGDETFIGMLPDDIGKRLITFMEGGNTYQACIKAISKKGIVIFIKEVSRAKKFKNQPSFLNPEQQKTNSGKTSRASQKSDGTDDEEE